MLKFLKFAVPAILLVGIASSTTDDARADNHGPTVGLDTAQDCAAVAFDVNYQVSRATTNHDGKDYDHVRAQAGEIIGWCNANQRRCRQRYRAEYGHEPGIISAVFRYDFEYYAAGDRSVAWFIDCVA